MTDLQTLLSRVEKATGPDRELDALIDITLFGGEMIWKQANYTMEMYPVSRRASANHVGGLAIEHVPLVTASVDAALAFAERVLPGCHIDMSTDNCAFVRIEDWDVGEAWNMPTLPIAIILAVLTAFNHRSRAND